MCIYDRIGINIFKLLCYWFICGCIEKNWFNYKGNILIRCCIVGVLFLILFFR